MNTRWLSNYSQCSVINILRNCFWNIDLMWYFMYTHQTCLGGHPNPTPLCLNISISGSQWHHYNHLSKDQRIAFGVCLHKLNVTKLKHQTWQWLSTTHDVKWNFELTPDYHLNGFIQGILLWTFTLNRMNTICLIHYL